MAPKRARTAAARASSSSSSSSSQSAGATKLTLHGGVPHHASLVALWHDERLTDFAVSAEGVEFKAHAPPHSVSLGAAPGGCEEEEEEEEALAAAVRARFGAISHSCNPARGGGTQLP